MAATTTPSNYGAIWNLNTPSTTARIPATESTFDVGRSGTEIAFASDARTRVAPGDYAPGGKYRSVIKLFARYERQRPNDGIWGISTGWLIAPDLLVTAGHVAYDFKPDTQYGKAVTIKAYMGYSGMVNATPEALNSGAVQLRYGKTFITTTGWLQSGGQAERADVSFLKLETPFTGPFTPFTYVDTPLTGVSQRIGVVGYPGDKMIPGSQELGPEMYEMFDQVTWNMDVSFENLLQYQISTYGGQSGSPVIRQSDGKVVAVHCLGESLVNGGSTINGKYGNMFDTFIRAFSEPHTPIGSILGINIFKPLTVGTDLLNLTTAMYASSATTVDESALPPADNTATETESFLDVLKEIGKVALPLISTGLQVASPFLGPLGAPASAIGGVALGALSKACESAFDPKTESFLPVAPPSTEAMHGVAERAVCAEAALQTALQIDASSPQGKKIVKQMADTYATLKPLENLHTKLFPAISGCTLRIALNDTLAHPAPETFLPVRKPLTDVAGTESSFNTNVNAPFAMELLQPTIAVPGEEGFFDTLGSVISTGLGYVAPILSSLAQKGVESALTATKTGTESSIEATTSDTVISRPLFRRALVAECALQAVQQIDLPTLKTLPLYDEHGNQSTEGFFDTMKTVMQTIGRKVIDTAPDVIRNVGPIALNLVADAIQKKASGGGTEMALGNGTDPNALSSPPISIAALADTRPVTPADQDVTVAF